MFIRGIVLRCAGTMKTRLESGPVTADLTTPVVHSSKLVIHDVKPDQSFTHIFRYSSPLLCPVLSLSLSLCVCIYSVSLSICISFQFSLCLNVLSPLYISLSLSLSISPSSHLSLCVSRHPLSLSTLPPYRFLCLSTHYLSLSLSLLCISPLLSLTHSLFLVRNVLVSFLHSSLSYLTFTTSFVIYFFFPSLLVQTLSLSTPSFRLHFPLYSLLMHSILLSISLCYFLLSCTFCPLSYLPSFLLYFCLP